MSTATITTSSLARHLLGKVETSEADMPYRLARLVARVLLSARLRQRRKWCALAQTLAQAPAVEERLVLQAMAWLSRKPGGNCSATFYA